MTTAPIHWVIHEYVGCEVIKNGNPITEGSDLQLGDTVSVWGSVGWMVTGPETIGKGKTIGFLEFDKDDRHCWVCYGLMNCSGLERLNISR